MQRQADWAMGKPGLEDISLSFQSDTEAYSGHLAKAQELSQRATESARRSDEKETAAKRELNAALREAEFGNPAQRRIARHWMHCGYRRLAVCAFSQLWCWLGRAIRSVRRRWRTSCKCKIL